MLALRAAAGALLAAAALSDGATKPIAPYVWETRTGNAQNTAQSRVPNIVPNNTAAPTLRWQNTFPASAVSAPAPGLDPVRGLAYVVGWLRREAASDALAAAVADVPGSGRTISSAAADADVAEELDLSPYYPAIYAFNPDASVHWFNNVSDATGAPLLRGGGTFEPVFSATAGIGFATFTNNSAGDNKVFSLTLAFNLSNGATLWTVTQPSAFGYPCAWTVGGGGVVYQYVSMPTPGVQGTGTLVVRNASTGEEIRNVTGIPMRPLDSPSVQGTLSADGGVLVLSTSTFMVAVDVHPNNTGFGRVMWTHSAEDGFHLYMPSPPAFDPSPVAGKTGPGAGRRLIVLNSTSLVVLNASTGVMLLSAPLYVPPPPSSSGSGGCSAQVFAATSQGVVAVVCYNSGSSTSYTTYFSAYNSSTGALLGNYSVIYSYPRSMYMDSTGTELYISASTTTSSTWTPGFYSLRLNATAATAPAEDGTSVWSWRWSLPNTVTYQAALSGSGVWPGPKQGQLFAAASDGAFVSVFA